MAIEAANAPPLLANELAGLPSTRILTAEYAMVRNDGERYVLALARSGVRVQVRRRLGTVHGLVSLPPELPSTAAAITEVCTALGAALA
jgi:acetyl esterase